MAEKILTDLHELPTLCNEIFETVDDIKAFAKNYGFREDAFFLGRSIDYAVAMEGSLKLKEISYIHAEAYAGGELKHGTLALIEEGVPVIALATQEDVREKNDEQQLRKLKLVMRLLSVSVWPVIR